MLAALVAVALSLQPLNFLNVDESALSVEGVGVAHSTGPRYVCRLGTVDPLATPMLKRRFALLNVTDRPVTIQRLESSCGCATVTLDGAIAPQPPTTLPARGGARVLVSIDTAHLRPGPIDKWVWVYAAGSATVAAAVDLTGTLLPLAIFSAPALEFGTVSAGSNRRMSLWASLDSRLVTSGRMPALVSSGGGFAADPDGPPRPVTRNGRAFYTGRYTVRLLRGASPGRAAALLRFASLSRAGAALSQISLPVRATIAGELSADPDVIAFGAVTAGETRTRAVVLNGASVGALRGLQVVESPSWLTLRFPGVGSTPAPRSLRLEVTLGKGSPTGNVETRIVIQNGAGTRLTLRVIAFISPPPPPKAE